MPNTHIESIAVNAQESNMTWPKVYLTAEVIVGKSHQQIKNVDQARLRTLIAEAVAECVTMIGERRN